MSLKGNVKEYLKQLADLKEEYKDKQQAILRFPISNIYGEKITVIIEKN